MICHKFDIISIILSPFRQLFRTSGFGNEGIECQKLLYFLHSFNVQSNNSYQNTHKVLFPQYTQANRQMKKKREKKQQQEIGNALEKVAVIKKKNNLCTHKEFLGNETISGTYRFHGSK